MKAIQKTETVVTGVKIKFSEEEIELFSKTSEMLDSMLDTLKQASKDEIPVECILSDYLQNKEMLDASCEAMEFNEQFINKMIRFFELIAY